MARSSPKTVFVTAGPIESTISLMEQKFEARYLKVRPVAMEARNRPAHRPDRRGVHQLTKPVGVAGLADLSIQPKPVEDQ